MVYVHSTGEVLSYESEIVRLQVRLSIYRLIRLSLLIQNRLSVSAIGVSQDSQNLSWIGSHDRLMRSRISSSHSRILSSSHHVVSDKMRYSMVAFLTLSIDSLRVLWSTDGRNSSKKSEMLRMSMLQKNSPIELTRITVYDERMNHGSMRKYLKMLIP